MNSSCHWHRIFRLVKSGRHLNVESIRQRPPSDRSVIKRPPTRARRASSKTVPGAYFRKIAPRHFSKLPSLRPSLHPVYLHTYLFLKSAVVGMRYLAVRPRAGNAGRTDRSEEASQAATGGRADGRASTETLLYQKPRTHTRTHTRGPLRTTRGGYLSAEKKKLHSHSLANSKRTKEVQERREASAEHERISPPSRGCEFGGAGLVRPTGKAHPR